MLICHSISCPQRLLKAILSGVALITAGTVQSVLADPLLLQPLVQSPSPQIEQQIVAEPAVVAAEADPLQEILQSMVVVNATVSDIARTAYSFGLERQGNGVVLDANGLIVTAGYVIAEAESITVTFSGGETAAAEFVAYDDNSGLGLLRAQTVGASIPIKLGTSASLKVGDTALILPASGETDAMTVQVGKLTRFTGGWEYALDDAIHTYPPNTQFAGAALLSDKAELLGIGALVTIDIDIDPKVRVPGNIFIPVDALTEVMGELLVHGRSSASVRPWLGLELKETKAGIAVSAVTDDGPAAQSGIRAGDVIVAVDQVKVTGLAQMYEKVWTGFEPGEQVHLLIIRDNQYANVPVESLDHYDWLRMEQNMDTAISEMTE